MKPITNNLTKYYFKSIIEELCPNFTNNQISNLLGISVSTIKKLKNSRTDIPKNKIDSILGNKDEEYLREEAVYACMVLFMSRGWQVGTTDSKCLFDVFCIKNNNSKRVQVRSGSKLSKNGFPKFKTGRILFNMTRVERTSFNKGDFDLWYFYHINGDAWLIPFELIKSTSEVSMENYYDFIVSR